MARAAIDAVEREAEQNSRGLDVLASELTNRDVPLVEPDLPIPQALRRLVKSPSGCLLVVDVERRPLGLVTDYDLIPAAVRSVDPNRSLPHRRALHEGPNFLDFLQDRKRTQALRVEDVMRHPVTAVDAQMTLGQVAALMLLYDQANVPVTDQGRVVGLLSSRNVLAGILGGAASW